MKSIYLTGANGLLGSNLSQYLNGHNLKLLTRSKKNLFPSFEYDLLNTIKFSYINDKITSFNPDFIINTVGLANVDSCEKNKKEAIDSNITFPVI